jgi:hypothetical protein
MGNTIALLSNLAPPPLHKMRTRSQPTTVSSSDQHVPDIPPARSRRAARKRETQQLPVGPTSTPMDDIDVISEAPPPAPKHSRHTAILKEDNNAMQHFVKQDDEDEDDSSIGLYQSSSGGEPSSTINGDATSTGPFSILNSSSIPELTTRTVRKILTAQRRALQMSCCLDPVEEVFPGWSRLEFNFKYTQGMARNRHAKHQRDSARVAAMGGKGLSTNTSAS